MHRECLQAILIPYSREVRQVESLANLAKRLQFAKLQSYKLVVTINIVLADPYFFHPTLEKSKFTKILLFADDAKIY